MDNGGLVIGRRYLGGMAEMEELISEPCDSPPANCLWRQLFGLDTDYYCHLVYTFVIVKNPFTFMHSIENVTALVFTV